MLNRSRKTPQLRGARNNRGSVIVTVFIFSIGIVVVATALIGTSRQMAYTARREDLLAHAADLFAAVARGAVTVDVNQTYPLSEAAQAHRDLEARRTTGTTVLLP